MAIGGENFDYSRSLSWLALGYLLPVDCIVSYDFCHSAMVSVIGRLRILQLLNGLIAGISSYTNNFVSNTMLCFDYCNT